jgi:hypothetical protein
MRETECESWRDFREQALRFSEMPRQTRELYIFRGQRDSGWGLETTLDRQYSGLSLEERQIRLQRLLREFGRELAGLEAPTDIQISDRLELLGRHHGLPTPVLDWSRSPYVAAYFAFESPERPASGRVAIWGFDTRSVARIPAAANVLIDDMGLIVQNPRAIEQRGVFLRLPVGLKGENLLSRGLLRFTIPHSERRVALGDLDEMMINAKSLFRDRDSAARTAVIRESLLQELP